MTTEPQDDGATMILAPWPDDVVAQLNKYQHLKIIHPYTCGNDACKSEPHAALVATKGGWICPGCDYTQNWASSMTAYGNWDIVETLESAVGLR